MTENTEKTDNDRRVVIIGATSGIGRELALKYLDQKCRVGITGRRTEVLAQIQSQYPDNCFYDYMDVTDKACVDSLHNLIDRMGGMDLLIYCAGVGDRNPALDIGIEMNAVYTNVEGFARIAIEAYNYFKTASRRGQIAVLSSVAATRPMRTAPAYSATKRFQAHYAECLAKRALKDKADVRFTVIKPGFIKTPLLNTKYPFEVNLDKGSKVIFNAIEKRKRMTIVPGRWRVIVFLWKLIPGWIWRRISAI